MQLQFEDEACCDRDRSWLWPFHWSTDKYGGTKQMYTGLHQLFLATYGPGAVSVTDFLAIPELAAGCLSLRLLAAVLSTGLELGGGCVGMCGSEKPAFLGNSPTTPP